MLSIDERKAKSLMNHLLMKGFRDNQKLKLKKHTAPAINKILFNIYHKQIEPIQSNQANQADWSRQKLRRIMT